MTAVTKKQIETLVKVQLIEIEAGKLKVYLEAVPAQIGELEQQLEKFIGSVENDEAAIEEFNKQYRALEADAKLNLTKIEKSQEKLRSVKTNKEYQSSLKEIDDIKTANSSLEDQMLEFLENIDNAFQVRVGPPDCGIVKYINSILHAHQVGHDLVLRN